MILVLDGGGQAPSKVNPNGTPLYFSYLLMKNNKPHPPLTRMVSNSKITESVGMERYKVSNIPSNEIPTGCRIVDDRGLGTNAIAEVIAAYYALKRFKDVVGEKPLEVWHDSKNVVDWINGDATCRKDWLLPWVVRIKILLWDSVNYKHVNRKIIVPILGH